MRNVMEADERLDGSVSLIKVRPVDSNQQGVWSVIDLTY